MDFYTNDTCWGDAMNYKSGLLSIVILTFFISYCHSADTTKIIYNDLSDLSLWQLNGSSAGVTNADQKKVLRLTPDKISQSGSAFITNQIKLMSDKGFMASFSAFFSFQISNTGGLDEGAGAGADGIVFIVQTVANNVGTEGGGIGYRGIKRSLGIEFDTWGNGELTNDPDGNHVGIDTNGNTQSVKTYSEEALFNNGDVWYAWIDYDGDNQNLEVRYANVNLRPVEAKLSYKVNLPSLLVQENAYVGFSSATGLSYNNHDILSFNFVNKFQPFVYDLSLSAKPDTIVKVHDSVYLTATIHDMNNIAQPDSAKKTEWRIIDSDGNTQDILKAKTGSEVLLVPQVAYTQVKIEGKTVVNGQMLIDTLTLQVTPGDPYQVIIESNRVTNDTSLLRHSHPIDTVTIVNFNDTASVFAVVRDKWGNYCRMADSLKTIWHIITGKELVSVTGISGEMYHGQIVRTIQTGNALVEASENGLTKDTVPVKILSVKSPYLIRAMYRPSSGLDNSGILQLYFSEDVDVEMLGKTIPEKTLKFLSSEGFSSEQILKEAVFNIISTEQYGNTISIKMGPGGKSIIPDRDSIQLIAGTVNRLNIPPDEKSGIKVHVEMLSGTISVAVSSNPVKLSQNLQSVLSFETINYYSNLIKDNTRGVIVAVGSSIPLKNINGTYGTAEIYDAVGNIVADHLGLKPANNDTRTEYGLFWNFTNRQNRIIGLGTYLVRIHTVDVKGNSHSLTTKIGISY